MDEQLIQRIAQAVEEALRGQGQAACCQTPEGRARAQEQEGGPGPQGAGSAPQGVSPRKTHVVCICTC